MKTPNLIIRIPAEVMSVLTTRDDFRFQAFAVNLRGDWVTLDAPGTTDHGKMFWECHDPSPVDAKEFMQYAQRHAGDKLNRTGR